LIDKIAGFQNLLHAPISTPVAATIADIGVPNISPKKTLASRTDPKLGDFEEHGDASNRYSIDSYYSLGILQAIEGKIHANQGKKLERAVIWVSELKSKV